MMTDKISTIDFRKNLRPDKSRYFVKDKILSLYLRCLHAEFTFYVDKMLRSRLFFFRRTRNLRFLKETADLSYVANSHRTSIIE